MKLSKRGAKVKRKILQRICGTQRDPNSRVDAKVVAMLMDRCTHGQTNRWKTESLYPTMLRQAIKDTDFEAKFRGNLSSFWQKIAQY